MHGIAEARSFLKRFLIVAVGSAALLFFAILLLDPYGVSPARLPLPRAIMDINQRYMYPQIARSRAFDSVVIGTSTSRLLDPKALDAAFGGRFANLAMNAGTAWEQTELAKLYLRHSSPPKTLILGVDNVWCIEGPAIERITFRGFPEWMYDEKPLNDLPELFNLKTLEIAGRMALHRIGLMPERIRLDGYEVFTPPEGEYNLARAQWHIWQSRPERRIVPERPGHELSNAQAAALGFPALAWLDDLLRETPAGTRRLLVFMPIHLTAQAIPGSRQAAVVEACKLRIDMIAARHNATVVDFAIDSPITREDSNYWDSLHYRLPIADRIVAGMKAALETGADDPDGVYRVRR